MVDNRVTVVSPEDQDRRLHTLPVWARERIQRAESALAARDAALTLIMRNADAAKEATT